MGFQPALPCEKHVKHTCLGAHTHAARTTAHLIQQMMRFFPGFPCVCVCVLNSLLWICAKFLTPTQIPPPPHSRCVCQLFGQVFFVLYVCAYILYAHCGACVCECGSVEALYVVPSVYSGLIRERARIVAITSFTSTQRRRRPPVAARKHII